ncbi:amidohydrolase family protein [Roseiconus nitratireducens]|uniref:Amidohydrolase family protein n=1 Tax=Roseiconus nitratireducens TaxID=2605748 RepID=A0A5M6DGY7_9BACT|nr:amidohydrolase family protein [Roseiconus nitratireducens]KAA5545540.1 amidohydrolase family protein [Roseiconus nitratireducens]
MAAKILIRVLLLPVALHACLVAWPDRPAEGASPDATSEATSSTEADSNPAEDKAGQNKSDKDWDVDSPPGPNRRQPIDCDTGTWMNLDVSPDGQSITFDLLGDVYVMPITGADGTEATGGQFPKNLTDSVAWDMQPRFSPDGNWIALTSDRTGRGGKGGDNVWIMARDGSKPQQVTSETFRLLCSPTWSPDGQYLVARKHFTSRRSLGAGEMWMYHRDAIHSGATAGVQLTKRPNDQKDVNEPVFSPDGRYLYYSQDVTPGDTFEYNKDSHKGIYAIKRLDLQEGSTETLIRGPGGACRPAPSPDGKTLAFVRRVGAKTGLHLFDLQSGAIRLVYDDLERDMQEAWAIHGVYTGYDWTPDGQGIVVWAKGKIRRIDVADGTMQVIPFRIKEQRTVQPAVRHQIPVAKDRFDVKMLRDVSVSPSGDQVVYQALGHLYLRALPDGEPVRLTDQQTHFEFSPSFSRDGRYIVYTTWNDQSLGTIRVASSDPAASENWIVSEQPGHFLNPVFTPDGSQIVYEKRGGGRIRSPLWSRQQGIYVAPTRGGPPRLVTEDGVNPQFGSSGDRLFLTRRNQEKDADNVTLCSVDLQGHDVRTHYRSDWATDFRVSPDGQSVALIERYHVFLAPFVQSPSPIQVGPDGKGVPTAKVSDQAGDFIHFSGDGKTLHWSLGPELFSVDVSREMTALMRGDESDSQDAAGEKSEPTADSTDQPQSVAIGFSHPHAKPEGSVALIGGRVLTMGSQGVLENATVLIRGNRIEAVGPADQIQIPDSATRIELKGQIVLPGFIDTHAHGAQATHGITPQHNWLDYARLAFGVTTIHDPSNDTHSIFAASEMTKAGLINAPRTFSTGTILYGATGAAKAEIDSLSDAEFHLRRMKAVGAFTVKSYNQPRRDQRQQVLTAARKLNMMVVPEGGSTFMHNMSMIVDGHTGIEHTLPVQTAYDDVMDLWRDTGVGYTPTLNVAYGGLSGEQYWYQIDDLWLHTRLQTFIPPDVLNPRARRREKSPLEDYNHIRVAEIARQVVEQGGLVQAGGHGQLPGICTHWEMWSFVQGGMTPMQALQCGTINGAKYLGLDGDLGSLEAGKLADVIVLRSGADPSKNIRDSEKVQYVIANGQVFEADRMNRFGDAAPRPPFFWDQAGGISSTVPADDAFGCSCHRGRQ